MDFLFKPWDWYVAGPCITITMAALLIAGRRFGISTSFATMCTMAGAGKWTDFFRKDWKQDAWRLFFVLGAVIGGFIASHFMMDDTMVGISVETIRHLESIGMKNPGMTYEPDYFSWDHVFTLKGIIIFLLGGFLVGFGVRYADGCTSGHAISGLSNLQLPSLIAVIGFFIGGLTMTHFILPYILQL
ncbi:MAG: YeeE/YedE family protein [Flavobacteriales bacterium]|nr:YeeE/YedE family protein [Flavobacteriales bacterium]